MMDALGHAWRDGREAAAHASEARSRCTLRLDFLLSRLLRLGHLPIYNQARRVKLRDMTVNYRFNRGDLQSLREVLIEEVYGGDLSCEPQTVLDLGANIGLFSLWMAARIRRRQTSRSGTPLLLAVEPVPENATVAEANFADNQIPGEVIRTAVGLRTREAWFEVRAESNLGRLSNASGPTGSIRVPVTGVHALLDRFPAGEVDLVKMDIEGAEEELLSGDTDWLQRVKALIVEWHDDRADSRPLIAKVEAAGFTHHRLNEKRQDNLSLFRRDGR